MEIAREELLANRDNPNRRRILSGAGRMIYPVLLTVASAQINKEYKLDVRGRENIPNTPSIIIASHQTHQDVKNYLVAIGKPVDTLAAIDGDSTQTDWLQLELTGVTPVLRGDDELGRNHQDAAYREMIVKAEKGHTQFACPEATYSPLHNDMLELWAGSAVSASNETKLPVIPGTGIYVPDKDLGVEASCVEFGKPFEPWQYPDLITAANALREIILEMKIRLNKEFNPGMAQAEWSAFRAAQAKRYPNDRDYYENAKYSLNYKLAKTPEEKAAVERMFREN